MDKSSSDPSIDAEATSSKTQESFLDPIWEKWRSEQVQTISNILSNVFKIEDEVRQSQAPSRILRNSAQESMGSEQEMYQKLSAIREQLSEYERVLELSRKRIDKVLQVIQPVEPTPEPPKTNTSPKFKHQRMRRLKQQIRHMLRDLLRRKPSK